MKSYSHIAVVVHEHWTPLNIRIVENTHTGTVYPSCIATLQCREHYYPINRAPSGDWIGKRMYQCSHSCRTEYSLPRKYSDRFDVSYLDVLGHHTSRGFAGWLAGWMGVTPGNLTLTKN